MTGKSKKKKKKEKSHTNDPPVKLMCTTKLMQRGIHHMIAFQVRIISDFPYISWTPRALIKVSFVEETTGKPQKTRT
jgi:hypothetical protein